eukprot:jgi/Mesvir1/13075/Mv06061-RA.1
MASKTEAAAGTEARDKPAMKVLFVQIGTGIDQHGQNITAAATRACKNAISGNSIPCFRTGALPGISDSDMKLRILLGVPKRVQGELDLDKVRQVFPYGKILSVDVVDGGLICGSGIALEKFGDKNEDCYVVNCSVEVGY